MSNAADSVLAEREDFSKRRVEEFSTALARELSDYDAEALGDHSCIYTTGSGGRLEMHSGSDLDVFLVRIEGSTSHIQAALLQSAVIRAMDSCRLPRPSQDGRFLTLHSAQEFIDLLGTPEDDERNKLTARMLLLLESRPIQGSVDGYIRLVGKVLEAYWDQSSKRVDTGDFLPIVLTNDIIRYWRILLLNHESNLREKSKKREKLGLPISETERQSTLDRRRSSYKLRFARCNTCFASLSYLLALVKFRHPPVLMESVHEMVNLTPLERLAAVGKMTDDTGIRDNLERLRLLYAGFLEASAVNDDEMAKQLANDAWWQEHGSNAAAFMKGMFDLVMSLREDNPLFRYVVV
jgi:hypothetical protein